MSKPDITGDLSWSFIRCAAEYDRNGDNVGKARALECLLACRLHPSERELVQSEIDLVWSEMAKG